VTTTIPVAVEVRDTDGMIEEGLKVYAFDGTRYTGYNGTTDVTGLVTFTLPMGDYRFRADKDGTLFWSSDVNHCPIPGCTSTTVTTTIPVAVEVRDTDGATEEGLKVYAFDGSDYTGYNGTTDVMGLVTFTLPMGDYRFRADRDGTHFWSSDGNHCAIPGCTGTVVTTTIPVVVTVEDSSGALQAGLKVYAFDGDTYTGYNTTDVTGLVTFTLPIGNYRFRTDKADAGASGGTQFWSGDENHCSVPGCIAATVTVASPDVTVTVNNTDGTPERGLRVYVFDEDNYTGYNGTTNVSGTLTLLLPKGDYRFRADKADAGASGGTQFWSSDANHCTVPGCGNAVVTTTVPVTVKVNDTDSTPEQGLKVYAFDGMTYSGYNETTDARGLVTFTLPMGNYRFRADKADAGASGGTQFWSGESNHCPIPGCRRSVVTTTIPVVVTVEDSGGSPQAGLKVYAFDGTTYTGYNDTTDSSGEVTFTLPEGSYRFRADKADAGASGGTQFWSSEANHCTVPGCTAATVTVASPDVTVMVQNTDGGLEVGLKVYAFDETTYTGYNDTTDSSGKVTFTLPVGDYHFRADKADAGASGGTQFWSGESNHCTVPGCGAVVVTTTVPLVVSVKDTDGIPEAGLKVYAFDETTYTGYNKTTDASGLVTFTLPMGDYHFRADKADAGASGGTQFWSGESNHCTIPGCTATVVTTTIPMVVTVEDPGGTPEQGLKVYAFDGTTYTGYNKTTDASGLVTFTLPMGDYRFRADKDGEQYWSGAANHCTVPGCTGVTVTVGSQAMKTPGLLLPDLSLLLLAPLAVAVLGKRKRWQRWAWPVAGALLVVAVISTGTALADAATPLPASEQMMEPASHRGETSDLLAVQRPETVNLPVNALPLVPATRPAFAGTITSTRVISYTYDPPWGGWWRRITPPASPSRMRMTLSAIAPR